ncbi:hypothetical protein [Sulfobacillus harzensis]|uniref:Uncharacterized protein n=1 Tax=Sulfobacillus harzensis TaxID=2729629 RepID=A0A7Y0L1B8_9FIRM|nr:hypothetical protein [Sulfobacillus harzensis]NMP21202.1 hypothetical protein [Sulfobacillus harzensis]
MAHSVGFYYSVLIWAAILYGAGVAFKFGSLFLYEAFMPWVTDEPVKKKPKPHPPRPAVLLWWWLGAYLILSGLAQIPPVVALMPTHLMHNLPLVLAQRSLGRAMVNTWLRGFGIHPIMYNILVFMIEAVLGLFLLTERGTPLGRVTAAISVAWGLFIAIFPEGIGFLFSCRNSWWSGAPGPGFLLAGLSLLLVLPDRGWEARYGRILQGAWIALWAIGTLVQLTFFSSQRLACLFPTGPHLAEPSFLWSTIRALHQAAARDPLVLNLVLTVLTALIGILGLRPRSTLSLVAALVLLLALWWLGQNIGLNAGFALMLNSAPLWAAGFAALQASIHGRAGTAS